MHTREELEAALRRNYADALTIPDEKYQVDVPDWLFTELAEIFFEMGGITTSLPENLIKRAAAAGVAVTAKCVRNAIYEVVLHKKFELTDPVNLLLPLEGVGMQDVEGLETLGDLVSFLTKFPGVLPYIQHDEDAYFDYLYQDLQAQGFVD